MAGTHNIFHAPSSVSFAFFTPEEVLEISAKKITNPILLDNLGRPNPGGLYDAALGPTRSSASCVTCGQRYDHCPGHIGHIELIVPVYHPLLFTDLFKLFRIVCAGCFHFVLAPAQCVHFVNRFRLLDAGLIADVNAYTASVVPSDKDFYEAIREYLSPEGAALLRRKSNPVMLHSQSKHGAVMRRQLISQFFDDNNKSKKCQGCQRPRSKLRNDRAGKIFRKFVNANPLVVEDVPSSSSEDDSVDGDVDEQNQTQKKKKEKRTKESFVIMDKRMIEEDPMLVDTGPAAPLKVDEQLVTPLEVRDSIRSVWNAQPEMCRFLFCSITVKGDVAIRKSSPEMFFVQILPVPAARFRPPIAMGDTMFEHPQNSMYSKILAANTQLVQAFQDKQQPEQSAEPTAPKKDSMARAMPAWLALQDSVNILVDSQKSASLTEKQSLTGIKQLLEKKEGMFRRFMMGKRVNYAARSVISPDPYIGTDEIGVPEIFARTLTFPEPVTAHNVAELRRLVINGPDVHPGANFVETEYGRRIDLSHMKRHQRIGIAKVLDTTKPHSDAEGCLGTKKVFRHLRTGDYVLMNRQPTLHRPGIMAHRVRVLKQQKTLRMHYANCNTYNADFDGDEMNMHFPQDELARTDAIELMQTNRQYIVPTSGKPLRGLIQDHVVSAVHMTIRNRFFTRSQVMQLLYPSLVRVVPPEHVFRLDPPAIMLPQPLYTGKQMISMLLKNLALADPSTAELKLNLKSTTRTPPEAWIGLENKDLQIVPETKVIIRQSELLVGVIDKNQIGTSSYGIVHAAFELFGAEYAGRLLTAFGKLFTLFLQTHQGFTCGLEDIVLTPDAEKTRQQILRQAQTSGNESAAKFLDLSLDTGRQELMQGLRQKLNTAEDSAHLDQVSKSPLHDITSQVQRAALPLGQFRRFPLNNLSMMTVTGAKGSNVNFSQISCLLGQQELEGKRVPRTIAGRTAPAFEPYDPAARAGGYISGRFLSGIGPQEYYFHCMAGREGLVDTAVKTSRSGYLQRCLIKYMEGLKVHHDNTVRDSDGSIVQFNYGEDSLDVCKTGYLEKLDFFADNFDSFWTQHKNDVLRTQSSAEGPKLNLDWVSEKFNNQIEDLIKKNPGMIIKGQGKAPLGGRKQIPADKLRSLLRVKFLSSMVHAGESVGVLAGQSIGEPSTQMTLNTFHLAGHGAVNVTMGIPRLREIVMTASKFIKSPIMYLPLLTSVASDQAAVVASKMCRVTLFNCLEGISVSESLQRKDHSSPLMRVYRLTLNFGDLSQQPITAKLPLSLLYDCLQHTFPQICDRTIAATLARKTGKIYLQTNFTAKARAAADDDDDDGNKDEGTGVVDGLDDSDQDADDGDSVVQGEGEGEGAKMERRKRAAYDDGEEDDDDSDRSQVDDLGIAERAAIQEDGDNGVEVDASGTTASGTENRAVGGRFVKHLNVNKKAGLCEVEVAIAASSRRLQMVELVEKVAKVCVVQSLPGITRAVTEKTKSGLMQVQTEGVNFEVVAERFSHVLNVNAMTSNDIGAILKFFGVEAARNSIVREMSSVFGVYGIAVDYRHLNLIADTMTFSGDFLGFNRVAIKYNLSPLLKMSFESCVTFLTEAACRGEVDWLKSPAASIVMGQVVGYGSGLSKIMHPLVLEKE